MNSGNFCYRNAAIQCLARVSPLTEYLLNEASLNALKKSVQFASLARMLAPVMLVCICNCLYRGDTNNNESFTTTLEYSKLLKEMWAAKKKNISPNSFNVRLTFIQY